MVERHGKSQQVKLLLPPAGSRFDSYPTHSTRMKDGDYITKRWSKVANSREGDSEQAN